MNDHYKCENCGMEEQDPPMARDLLMKMKVGDIFTDRQCSSCGCLSHPVGDEPEPLPTTHLYGWECPRCGTVHAPFAQKCECGPPVIVTTTYNTGGTIQE